MSSTPLYTTLIEPAVKRLLPPDSSSGAASSITTLAPCSCAASAAQNAAFPPPTTTTSYSDIASSFHTRGLPSVVVPAKAGTHIPEAGVYGSPPSRGRQEGRWLLNQFSTTRHSIVS